MGGLRCTHPYRFRYRRLGDPVERTWAVFYKGSHIGDARELRYAGRWEWWMRKPGEGAWTREAYEGYSGHRYGCAMMLFGACPWREWLTEHHMLP